nr:uncharacterized protein LOC127297785 [Lolium perenne]
MEMRDSTIDPMDDETPIMEKMYMVHEDDDITPCLIEDEHGGHVEPSSSTTPTSYEREYKGTYMGVDDAMIPLVDMKIDECMHDLDDTNAMSYASFIFPCDALIDTNIVDHVDLIACDNMTMPCYECFDFYPIACNLSNNCSFPCIACNENDDANSCVVTTLPNNFSFPRFVDNNNQMLNMFCATCLQYSPINATKMMNNFSFQCLACNSVNMLVNEIAPIALSNFGDFAYIHVDHVPMFTPHIHHIYYDAWLNANGDVQKKWNIMMDAVFIYHAHTFFVLPMVCVGTQNPMSTSIEHELTKRALESVIQVSSNEWFRPHTSTTQDLSMRAHRHFDKVTSFNLRSLAIPMELRLLFECCVACLVLLIGFMISDATFKSCCHLPPLPVHDELSSRSTLFQVGGDDVARPSVFGTSYASTPTCHAKVNLLLYACVQLPMWNGMLLHPPSYDHDRNTSPSTEEVEDAMDARGLKAEVVEAWKKLQAQLHRSRRPRQLTTESPAHEDQDRSLRPTYTRVSGLCEALATSQLGPRPMYPLLCLHYPSLVAPYI